MDLLKSAATTVAERPSAKRVGIQIPWKRLIPLWRHAVGVVAIFIMLAVGVTIRLDVQRLQMDLDRNDRAHRAAVILHERLELELDVRRRMQAMELEAEKIGATPEATLIHLSPEKQTP